MIARSHDPSLRCAIRSARGREDGRISGTMLRCFRAKSVPGPDYRRPLRDGHDQDRGRLQRAAGAALLPAMPRCAPVRARLPSSPPQNPSRHWAWRCRKHGSFHCRRGRQPHSSMRVGVVIGPGLESKVATCWAGAALAAPCQQHDAALVGAPTSGICQAKAGHADLISATIAARTASSGERMPPAGRRRAASAPKAPTVTV
jgi:hypothetical protein